ncbi:MAG TPA: DUF3024 domain-containing protein [Bacteroidia bacterium]|nr:DUF3024 domain-containing protein [Bacteroidia bacterium]
MVIDTLKTLEVIEAMENFISRKRPLEEIRNKVDLSYRIENQSIIIFEIRPAYNNPDKKLELDVAKTTFVKAKNHWKIFWMRADLKWHPYSPNEIVKSVNEFCELVEKDEHGCFWG